ncbi:MAG TPA: helix-turn-helix domain-containing protein [Verrucomicrobiae bacterium]
MKSLQPARRKTGKTAKTFMDEVSESNQIEKQARKIEREDRLAYSIPEAADLLGLDYFTVYRLVLRGKLKACRALRGKFLITRAELNRLLNEE